MIGTLDYQTIIMMICLFAGGILVTCLAGRIKTAMAHRRRAKRAEERRPKTEQEEIRNALGTMDRILILLGVAILLFIITMIVLFVLFKSVPDTLIVSVFALCGLEAGVMGRIQTNKEKLKAKEWELKHPQKEASNDGTGNQT